MHESDLTAIALKLADGTPIDWQALKSEAPDAYTRLINRFQEIEALSRAHVGIGPQSAQEFESIRNSLSVDEGAPVRWGHLEILDKVGRGSYGDVYRARDSRLDRIVALKLLRRSDGHDNAASESEIIEEARLIARVRHPNVVTVHGAERIDGRTGVWMEFVEGRTLQEIVSATGPLKRDEVRRIGIQLCRALAAVHACGLLHRDVKAQNVMLSTDGRVLLMDFSAVVDHEKGQGTYPLAGTPLYAAPEVLAGKPASIRSDLYGLGVLLHYIGTGMFPVNGESVEAIQAAHLVRANASRPMRQRLGPALAATIARAIDSDPSRRFEDAPAFEQALFRSAPWHWPRLRMRAGVVAVVLVMAIVGFLGAGQFVAIQSYKSADDLTARREYKSRLDADAQLQREQDLRDVLARFHPSVRHRDLGVSGGLWPSVNDIPELEAHADLFPDDMEVLNRLLMAFWRGFATRNDSPLSTNVPSRANSTKEFKASLVAKRRQRILWLIAHHPEADLAGRLQAQLFADPLATFFPGDPDGYSQAKQMWLDATARRDVRAAVLDHAAAFFETSDQPLAERLLLRAQSAGHSLLSSVRLGVFYAEAVTGGTPLRMLEIGTNCCAHFLPSPEGADTPFAWVARAKLAETVDPILLVAAGTTFARTPFDRETTPISPLTWAQDCYRRAVQAAPDSVVAHSELIAINEQLRDQARRDVETMAPVPLDKQVAQLAMQPQSERLIKLTDLALEASENFEAMYRSPDPDLRTEADLNQHNAVEAAHEALDLAERRRDAPDYGTGIYISNMVLGSFALREGDKAAAGRYLQAAAQAPPSEWLAYSTRVVAGKGALSLPEKMLAAGERTVVAEFLEQMTRLSLARRLDLRVASAAVRRGDPLQSLEYCGSGCLVRQVRMASPQWPH